MFSGYAYSQSVVVPAETEDIEAFDNALMTNQRLMEKLAEKKESKSLKKAKEDEIEKAVAEEANKLKKMDERSRDELRQRMEEKARAANEDLNPNGASKAADIVAPPEDQKNASTYTDPNPKNL
jgi:DNA topoisomerase VI subunit B